MRPPRPGPIARNAMRADPPGRGRQEASGKKVSDISRSRSGAHAKPPERYAHQKTRFPDDTRHTPSGAPARLSGRRSAAARNRRRSGHSRRGTAVYRPGHRPRAPRTAARRRLRNVPHRLSGRTDGPFHPSPAPAPAGHTHRTMRHDGPEIVVDPARRRRRPAPAAAGAAHRGPDAAAPRGGAPRRAPHRISGIRPDGEHTQTLLDRWRLCTDALAASRPEPPPSSPRSVRWRPRRRPSSASTS